jgi:hypothetical protein
MSKLKISNNSTLCLNLEDAKQQKIRNEAKIAAGFGSTSGASLVIMLFLISIRYSLPAYKKKENLYWIIAFFALSLICAAAILGLFIKEHQDFKRLKHKMATIEHSFCEVCKQWMNYTPSETKTVTVSAITDTYELPQDTFIQKIVIQSTVKPTVYWITEDGTTTDVTNIFDFTKVQSGYECIVNTIYITGSNKLTIDPHDSSISYLSSEIISDTMREFIVTKQIIAQTCTSDVVVISDSKLVQTPLLCCM